MLYKFKQDSKKEFIFCYTRENTGEHRFILRQEAIKWPFYSQLKGNYSLLLLEEKTEHNGRKLKNPLLKVLCTVFATSPYEIYVEPEDVEPLFK